MSALDTQVGGSHYKQYKIQPKEFFIKNQIPSHKATIIERILRYDHPTGKGMEDLEKIKHEVDLIVEIERWEDKIKRFPNNKTGCMCAYCGTENGKLHIPGCKQGMMENE